MVEALVKFPPEWSGPGGSPFQVFGPDFPGCRERTTSSPSCARSWQSFRSTSFSGVGTVEEEAKRPRIAGRSQDGWDKSAFGGSVQLCGGAYGVRDDGHARAECSREPILESRRGVPVDAEDTDVGRMESCSKQVGSNLKPGFNSGGGARNRWAARSSSGCPKQRRDPIGGRHFGSTGTGLVLRE